MIAHVDFGGGVAGARGGGRVEVSDAGGGACAGAALTRGAAPARASRAELLRERRDRHRRERESQIDRLLEAAVRSGEGPCDRTYWSLVYDLELAPVTTNRRQLTELGVEVPPEGSLGDAELSVQLRLVIDALADVYTYLVHTDHLSDRDLYRRLCENVLDEPVHEICEGSGGREFIDMAGGASAEDRAEWLRYYATDEERAEARAAGMPVPERRPLPHDRDRTLPQPP